MAFTSSSYTQHFLISEVNHTVEHITNMHVDKEFYNDNIDYGYLYTACRWFYKI